MLEVAAGRRPYITIFGTDYPTPDGTCVRDYVHVEDLARAHVLALAGLGERAVARRYNLGCGGEGYSMREVIETAVRVTGGHVPVEISARRAGDPTKLVASSQRIRRDLGWMPRHQQLEQIIGSAWQWMTRRGLAG